MQVASFYAGEYGESTKPTWSEHHPPHAESAQRDMFVAEVLP